MAGSSTAQTVRAQAVEGSQFAMQPDVMPIGDSEAGSSGYATPMQLEEAKPYPGVDYLGVGCMLLRSRARVFSPASLLTRPLSNPRLLQMTSSRETQRATTSTWSTRASVNQFVPWCAMPVRMDDGIAACRAKL